MGRPGTELISWRQLSKDQPVHFYTADGWRKGHVSDINTNSATVLWDQGSTQRNTNVYDLRNIRLNDAGPKRSAA